MNCMLPYKLDRTFCLGRTLLPLPGHSLGGALAQLAAHDISTAAAAEGLYVRVVCYTFGAPRVRFSAGVSWYMWPDVLQKQELLLLHPSRACV